MSALPRARAWSTTNGHAAAAATTTTSTTTASSSTAAKLPTAAAGPPPTSSPPFPRPPGGAATTATTSVSTEQKKHTTHVTTLTQHHRDHLLYRAPSSGAARARARSRSSSTGTVDNDNEGEGEGDGNDEPVVVAAPTFLQPRVAAVLGVSRRWHPVLFSLRLLSIVPGIILSFPMIIRFLLMLHAFATSPPDSGDAGTGTTGGDHDHTLLGSAGRSAAPGRLLLTETMLAILWVNTATSHTRPKKKEKVHTYTRCFGTGEIADHGALLFEIVRLFGLPLLLLYGLPYVPVVSPFAPPPAHPALTSAWRRT